jgi:hypothetical protein
MNDENRINTFSYAFSPEDVAKNLASRLRAAAKMLNASDEFYVEPSAFRGQLHVILSMLERLVDDARIRVVELRQLDAAESQE